VLTTLRFLAHLLLLSFSAAGTPVAAR
jgi:hypothetical protein